ncbi:hypothetical protein PIB30_092412 [Stylosanthes scabra]|uniref:Uncharacterized protein n=1 Tax=Stylosanthes scabra TaxID=79078 RepID=A0ABU6QW79_9FABA|nr:hypothetical protein [Stylosanthes scabra]
MVDTANSEARSCDLSIQSSGGSLFSSNRNLFLAIHTLCKRLRKRAISLLSRDSIIFSIQIFRGVPSSNSVLKVNGEANQNFLAQALMHQFPKEIQSSRRGFGFPDLLPSPILILVWVADVRTRVLLLPHHMY